MPTINNGHMVQSAIVSAHTIAATKPKTQKKRLLQLEGKEGALNEITFEIWVDIPPVTTTVLPNDAEGFLFPSTMHRKKPITYKPVTFCKKVLSAFDGRYVKFLKYKTKFQHGKALVA